MTGADALLETAREAYAQRDWVTARAGFAEARARTTLGPDDLCALANCAWWLGDLDGTIADLRSAFRQYLAADRPNRAAMVALDTGYCLAMRGDRMQGSGWMQRAARLLADRPACIEHGCLAYIQWELAFEASELEAAHEAADQVRSLAQRFSDPTLTALGALAQGRVLIEQGSVRTGMALLDEAMVAAVSDELEPAWAGSIYCHLMRVCDEIVDVLRAVEWTKATARWCASMPGSGPFMGICRVHRAHVLCLRGAWEDAEREIAQVCAELADFDIEVVAEAEYERGELRRAQGDLSGAEASFRESHRLGRDPQPGLASLRLKQGQAGAAMASIRAALASARGQALARARLLPAAIEIALAVEDSERARAWSDELSTTARRYGTSGLGAQSRASTGAVRLADGEAGAALTHLKAALSAWHALAVPYEAARVRTLLAQAYEALGDHGAAALERDAARSTLAHRRQPPDAPATRDDALTERETQILRMVSSGQTNQQIATDLVLSVRTVERHLATVYRKLGFHGRNARAAAVGYALREIQPI